MPVEYRYDSALNAVVSTVTGVLDEREILTHLRKLLVDEAVPSGMIEIVDFSLAADFAVKASGAAVIASQVAELSAQKDYQGTTFFAPNDLSFGMARMFQAMMENQGLHVEIYRDWDKMAAVVTERLRKKKTRA